VTISILDLGIGNVTSMANALRALNEEPDICDTSQGVLEADHLIVPGVGAFQYAMKRVNDLRLQDALRTRVMDLEMPTLGVCLGAQLFFTLGTEGGECDGINAVPGNVRRIDVGSSALRLPHTGWDKVDVVSTLGDLEFSSGYYYFNHEYHCVPNNPSVVTAYTQYGNPIVAAYQIGALWGFQFHPEKSQRLGLSAIASFLRNFS
jgi:imidazole glycerol-phosphate synthase subunit HisH